MIGELIPAGEIVHWGARVMRHIGGGVFVPLAECPAWPPAKVAP